MAAALASLAFKELVIDIEVLSAGVATDDGYPASDNAILAMQEQNLCLAKHKSAQINTELCDAALILTMTQGHLFYVKQINTQANAFTLGEYVGANGDIADPFGGNLEVYRACAAQIKELVTLAAAKYKEELWNQ